MKIYRFRTVIYSMATVLLSLSLLSSCTKDFLEIVPKGLKVPSTINDYRGFLENIMNTTHLDMFQKSYLVNEFYQNPNNISNPPTLNNYLWIETPGARIDAVQMDNGYTSNYSSMFRFNLVINEVPKLKNSNAAQEKEARVLVAQAKVFRALFLFHLVNTYAKAYTPATASTDNGIPYISTASEFEGQIPQETVGQIYTHIMDDLNTAIPELEEQSINYQFPVRLAAVGLRARIHLFMHNFDAALADADAVLQRHNSIYDMVAYHMKYIDKGIGGSIQNNRPAFSGLPAVGLTEAAIENVWGVGGRVNIDYRPSFSITVQLPAKDSVENQNYTRSPARFEDGDTRFLCNFYNNSAVARYDYRRSDYGNTGGIRTLEMFLIRAECYARKGDLANINKAMDDIDAIRIKRIIASKYQPLKGRITTKMSAMDVIRHERDVELMGMDMIFYDMRRFNTENEYERTMVKKDDKGIIRTLRPESPLWVMPFPKAVTEKNPNIKQNTTI